MMDKTIDFSCVYIAYFVIEAKTPLAVGSGDKGFTVDRLIARDADGWPYIPGSAIAGVLRHQCSEDDSLNAYESTIFGYQNPANNDGEGSRLIVSSAHIVGGDGQTVKDGISAAANPCWLFDFLQKLPIREHVRINDRGTAEKHGKFDEQVVPVGTRFAFRIELIGNDILEEIWKKLLQLFWGPNFRLGAGTRNGFGEIKIISCKTKKFALRDDLSTYLDLDSSLDPTKVQTWTDLNLDDHDGDQLPKNWGKIELELNPENFFLFGSGHGDSESDQITKRECILVWNNNIAEKKEVFVIPGSSIKGALAHRVAYHYNKQLMSSHNPSNSSKDGAVMQQAEADKILEEIFRDLNNELVAADDEAKLDKLITRINAHQFDEMIDEINTWNDFKNNLNIQTDESGINLGTGNRNEAVRTLFGYASDDETENKIGNVIISDYIIDKSDVSEKIFNHVAIDRFTGGARNGMLFQQKVATTNNSIDLTIFYRVPQEKKIETALLAAIDDLREGRLQIGGSSMKGHGVFKKKNNH